MPRENVHVNAFNQVKKMHAIIEKMQEFTTMTFARNSYARLFSEYIDEAYMPYTVSYLNNDINNYIGKINNF